MSMNSNSVELVIGNYHDFRGAFAGNIDEVGVFSRALLESEIEEIMNYGPDSKRGRND